MNVVNSFDTNLFPCYFLFFKDCIENIKSQYIPGKMVSTAPTKTVERDWNVNLASQMAAKLSLQSNIEFTDLVLR